MSEITRTWLLCTLTRIEIKPLRRILDAWRRHFIKRYFREYSRLSSVVPERIELWKVPVIAARLPEEPDDHQKEVLLSALEKQLRNIKSGF